MVEYVLTETVESHIDHVARNMRQADRVEIWLSSRSEPLDALRKGLEQSDQCYTLLVDDAPTLIFGIVERSILDRTGTIWMLGTDDIHKIRFGRLEFTIMQNVLNELVADYNVVENYVHAQNDTSIKWLRAMGFEFDDPAPLGVFGAPFQHFEMRAH